jgi:hypothetical protein
MKPNVSSASRVGTASAARDRRAPLKAAPAAVHSMPPSHCRRETRVFVAEVRVTASARLERAAIVLLMFIKKNYHLPQTATIPIFARGS